MSAARKLRDLKSQKTVKVCPSPRCEAKVLNRKEGAAWLEAERPISSSLLAVERERTGARAPEN